MGSGGLEWERVVVGSAGERRGRGIPVHDFCIARCRDPYLHVSCLELVHMHILGNGRMG